MPAMHPSDNGSLYRSNECLNDHLAQEKEIMTTKQLEKAFTIFFNLTDGLSNKKESSKRYLSEIKHIFMESEQAEKYLNQQSAQ